MNNKINKQFYYEAINLVRNLDNNTKNQAYKSAFKNFQNLWTELMNNEIQKVLIIFNSGDELDISNWISFLQKQTNLQLYGLNNKRSQRRYINLNQPYDYDIYINRLQPISKNISKHEIFDLIIVPISLFKLNKECLDNSLNTIYPWLKLQSKKPIIIGYAYSINQFNFLTNDENVITVDYLITNRYLID